MYVIGRLAPEHSSGCIYWNGRVRPHEAAGGGDYAETAAPESIWTADSREIAEATALWLNTSPVALGQQGGGLWQAIPIPNQTKRPQSQLVDTNARQLSGNVRIRLICRNEDPRGPV